MRTALFLSIAAVSLAAAAAAHAQIGYAPGRTVVSGSIGAGISGIYGTAEMPLMAVSAEHGLNDEISIGGSLGIASSKVASGYDAFGGEYSLTYGYTIVAARGSYHFTDLVEADNLDLYAGASLGYNRVSLKAREAGSSQEVAAGSYVLYGVHLGGRYHFTPRFAGFLELGYGLGHLAAGLSLRL